MGLKRTPKPGERALIPHAMRRIADKRDIRCRIPIIALFFKARGSGVGASPALDIVKPHVGLKMGEDGLGKVFGYLSGSAAKL